MALAPPRSVLIGFHEIFCMASKPQIWGYMACFLAIVLVVITVMPMGHVWLLSLALSYRKPQNNNNINRNHSEEYLEFFKSTADNIIVISVVVIHQLPHYILIITWHRLKCEKLRIFHNQLPLSLSHIINDYKTMKQFCEFWNPCLQLCVACSFEDAANWLIKKSISHIELESQSRHILYKYITIKDIKMNTMNLCGLKKFRGRLVFLNILCITFTAHSHQSNESYFASAGSSL